MLIRIFRKDIKQKICKQQFKKLFSLFTISHDGQEKGQYCAQHSKILEDFA